MNPTLGCALLILVVGVPLFAGFIASVWRADRQHNG